MERPRSPFREVVDEDNAEVLGTLHPKAWSAFQEAWEEANFFGVEAAKTGLLRGLRMTGSISGEHRKDIVEAIKGQRQQTVALGLPNQETPANGKASSNVPRL